MSLNEVNHLWVIAHRDVEFQSKLIISYQTRQDSSLRSKDRVYCACAPQFVMCAQQNPIVDDSNFKPSEFDCQFGFQRQDRVQDRNFDLILI